MAHKLRRKSVCISSSSMLLAAISAPIPLAAAAAALNSRRLNVLFQATFAIELMLLLSLLRPTLALKQVALLSLAAWAARLRLTGCLPVCSLLLLLLPPSRLTDWPPRPTERPTVCCLSLLLPPLLH